MQETHEQSSKPLKETLLSRIEHEQVCPHSRLFFQGREAFFWFLWLLSVFVGALAIAVSLFVILHGQYAFYEATHENFFTFMVEALPYLWIMTFGIMVYIAVFNLRHTKRGYRYPLWMIMASSVVLSFAGGSALQLFGFGYELDEVLGEHMVLYTSQKKFEERLWQDPDDGRLVGMQVYTTLAPTSTIVFEDMTGCRWIMRVNELSSVDIEVLASGSKVRVLGKPVDEDLHLFHGCGVFPWLPERPLTRAEMGEQRQHFVEKIGAHARHALDHSPRLLGTNIASTTLATESVCASIKSVRRLPVLVESEE